jgi:hypothetical protein
MKVAHGDCKVPCGRAEDPRRPSGSTCSGGSKGGRGVLVRNTDLRHHSIMEPLLPWPKRLQPQVRDHRRQKSPRRRVRRRTVKRTTAQRRGAKRRGDSSEASSKSPEASSKEKGKIHRVGPNFGPTLIPGCSLYIDPRRVPRVAGTKLKQIIFRTLLYATVLYATAVISNARQAYSSTFSVYSSFMRSDISSSALTIQSRRTAVDCGSHC